MRHPVWYSLLTAMLLCLICMAACAEDTEPAVSYSGYVCVTCGNEYRWYPLPLPEQEEYERTIRQVTEDGTEYTNTIHFTHDGVYMSESTCENQDCVGEGIVTLDNKDTRILGSWIICLPHQVYLELFSAEELMTLMNMAQE